MSRRRVVITGIGVVTPLGSSLGTFWHGLSEGISGIGRISSFDASNYPVQIAAEVRNWSLADVGENPRQWERAPRQSAFTIGAGIDALKDSGLDLDQFDPIRSGVYLGCGEPFTQFDPFTQSIASVLQGQSCGATSLNLYDPEAQRQFDPSMPAISLSARFNLQGPSLNCIAACVSSTQAIGEAVRMIRRGETDMMLCGGGHSCVHELGVTGFSRLSALSGRNDTPESASRPFDLERDGFVIGEGAAILVAEEYEQARRRGATIYGEVSGYGSTQDAFRVTDAHPDGRGSADAMTRALADARLGTDQIDYINAHGTGTVLNDKVETLAIKGALGADAKTTPMSSIKSMLGHATTACGAIETAACLLSLKHGALPPTINYSSPDPGCDLDCIPNVARELTAEHILNNNIGFGGQNAALILSRVSEASKARQAA